MKEKQDPVKGNMRSSNQAGDDFVDQCRARLRFKEDGIVGKECRIEVFEDGGKVDSLIFNTDMVTVDS